MRPLNYVPYMKDDAIQLLQDRFGWQPYPQKHFESRFTQFYEGYWLPKKFGFDTRRVQYSSLILTEADDASGSAGDVDNTALRRRTIEHDIEFVATKLGITWRN